MCGKACPKCGEGLVMLSSQNTKMCANCKLTFDWSLKEGETSMFGDRVRAESKPSNSR